MVLGWLFWRKEKTTVGQPALRSGRPRGHTRNGRIETNDDMRGDLDNFFKHWQCVAQNVVGSGEGLKYNEK